MHPTCTALSGKTRPSEAIFTHHGLPVGWIPFVWSEWRTTFDIGTGTLRPPPGHLEHQGHGFVKKLSTSDPQAATAGLRDGPTPSHRLEHVPMAVKMGSNPGGLAVVPNHLALVRKPAGGQPGPHQPGTVGCHEPRGANTLFSAVNTIFGSFINRGCHYTGYIHPSDVLF